MVVKRATQNEFLEQQQNLLPPGKAWPREKGAVLTQYLKAKASVQAATHNRAVDLLDEADPRTASETFEDWERVYGLPDPCLGEDQTVSQRRAALLAKITARGGQTPAYYEAMLATIGVPCEVVEYPVFRADMSGADDVVGESHSWAIKLPAQTAVYFRADVSHADDPLEYQANEQVECLINKHKPAHTTVTFLYGEL